MGILRNGWFIGCTMAVIIFVATQLLKLPIKHFTKKIKDESKRKLVNSTILLIPFVLGIFLAFLHSTCVHTTFYVITGLKYGTAGISLYGIIERFFNIKIKNPYDTEEGKAVTDLVNNITADGKIDSSDSTAVQEFLDKVKK